MNVIEMEEAWGWAQVQAHARGKAQTWARAQVQAQACGKAQTRALSEQVVLTKHTTHAKIG